MIRQDNLMICTIDELAEKIACSVNDEDVSKSKFEDCDFAVVCLDDEPEDESRTLEDIRRDANGWHGIKRIETGFDSEALILVADYYGGSTAFFFQFFDGMSDLVSVKNEVLRKLIQLLEISEIADKDTELIVEYIGDDDGKMQNA